MICYCLLCVLFKLIKIYVDIYCFYRCLDCYVFFFGDVFFVFILNLEYKVNFLDKFILDDIVFFLCFFVMV